MSTSKGTGTDREKHGVVVPLWYERAADLRPGPWPAGSADELYPQVRGDTQGSVDDYILPTRSADPRSARTLRDYWRGLFKSLSALLQLYAWHFWEVS